MPMDKVKNTRKGFCFITFEQEAVVQNLIRAGKTRIKDIEVGVKKATPKPDGGMRGGPRGGRGEWGAVSLPATDGQGAVNPAPPGLFPYPRPPGGGGSDLTPPPGVSRTNAQWLETGSWVAFWDIAKLVILGSIYDAN